MRLTNEALFIVLGLLQHLPLTLLVQGSSTGLTMSTRTTQRTPTPTMLVSTAYSKSAP